MHPYSSLGPIDPQITVIDPDGVDESFGYEDVGAFLRFLSEEVKLSEQVHVAAVIDKLFSVVDPVLVGYAKRASELSSSIGERLLLQHMTDMEERSKAQHIAEDLNKSFLSHGDAVSRSRAQELNLRIAERDVELERLIWDAFIGIESHMKLRKPFDPLGHFLSEEAEWRPTRQLQSFAIPPIELAEGVGDNGGGQEPAVFPAPVKYSLVHALVESDRLASESRTDGILRAFQTSDGQLDFDMLTPVQGWEKVAIDEK